MKRVLTLLTTFALVFGASPARAEGPSTVIAVYGDSLADGLWSGLYELTKTQPMVRLLRHSHIGTGLTRPDFAAWQIEIKADLDADGDTVVVIMVGANDMQGIRAEDRIKIL